MGVGACDGFAGRGERAAGGREGGTLALPTIVAGVLVLAIRSDGMVKAAGGGMEAAGVLGGATAVCFLPGDAGTIGIGSAAAVERLSFFAASSCIHPAGSAEEEGPSAHAADAPGAAAPLALSARARALDSRA